MKNMTTAPATEDQDLEKEAGWSAKAMLWALTLPLIATVLGHIPAYIKHPDKTANGAAAIMIVVGSIAMASAITIAWRTHYGQERIPRKVTLAAAAGAAACTGGVIIACRSVF